MPKIKVMVGTNKAEHTIDISREELDGMSEQDLEELAKEEMFQMIEWDFDVIEDADA